MESPFDLLLLTSLIAISFWRINRYLKDQLEKRYHLKIWNYAAKTRLFRLLYNTSPLTKKTESSLASRFDFFRNFPPPLQKFYCYRLNQIINTFTFIASDNSIIIDEELKAIILAQAARLTLGFSDYKYKTCFILEIHSDVYFSKETNQWHKGEVSTNGTIKLSTKWLNKGDINELDGVNLAIHEFSHAIMVDLFVGEEGNHFYENFMKYKKIARNHIEEIEQRKIFREYAFENDHEFFAVTTEVFFETPTIIKREFPPLYEAMCELFNQHPHQANPLDF